MPRVPHPPRPPQPFRSTSASEQRAVAAASFDSSGFRRSPPFENGRVGGWESDLRRGASELELCVFFGVLRGGFAAVSAAPLSFPFGVQSSVTLVEDWEVAAADSCYRPHCATVSELLQRTLIWRLPE